MKLILTVFLFAFTAYQGVDAVGLGGLGDLISGLGLHNLVGGVLKDLVGGTLKGILEAVNSLIDVNGPLGLHTLLNNLKSVLKYVDDLIDAVRHTVNEHLIPLIRDAVRFVKEILRELLSILGNRDAVEHVCGKCNQLREHQCTMAEVGLSITG